MITTRLLKLSSMSASNSILFAWSSLTNQPEIGSEKRQHAMSFCEAAKNQTQIEQIHTPLWGTCSRLCCNASICCCCRIIICNINPHRSKGHCYYRAMLANEPETGAIIPHHRSIVTTWDIVNLATLQPRKGSIYYEWTEEPKFLPQAIRSASKYLKYYMISR